MTHPNPVPVNSNNGEPRTLGRRTLLRGAAHSVWALPAIQLAATAPAYALSGEENFEYAATLQVTAAVTNPIPEDGGAWLSIPATINNGGRQIPAGRTLIVATIPGGSFTKDQVAPEGWTVTRQNNQTLNYTYTHSVGAYEQLALALIPAMNSKNEPDLTFTLFVDGEPMGDPITMAFPWEQ